MFFPPMCIPWFGRSQLFRISWKYFPMMATDFCDQITIIVVKKKHFCWLGRICIFSWFHIFLGEKKHAQLPYFCWSPPSFCWCSNCQPIMKIMHPVIQPHQIMKKLSVFICFHGWKTEKTIGPLVKLAGDGARGRQQLAARCRSSPQLRLQPHAPAAGQEGLGGRGGAEGFFGESEVIFFFDFGISNHHSLSTSINTWFCYALFRFLETTSYWCRKNGCRWMRTREVAPNRARAQRCLRPWRRRWRKMTTMASMWTSISRRTSAKWISMR